MSARRSSAATGVLAVLFVTAGCDATPQQQQSGALCDTADDLSCIVASAIQRELRPVVSRLESLVESLDGRVTLLDSRVSELNRKLLSQQSQLTVLELRVDKQQYHPEDKIYPTMDNDTARLDNHTAQPINLASQQSRGPFNLTPMQHAGDDLRNDTSSLPHDCSELPAGSPSGIYSILPSSDYQPVQAYCDMDSAGGNWTVIQRRDDVQPRQDFYLGWAEYRRGFGNLTGEFWWGLENMHQLTSSNETQYELRVELETFNGDQAFAVYRGFRVSSEDDGYRLTASYVTGGAGDGLLWSVNMKFTTKDRDHDQSSGSPGNCAQIFKGAFWYSNCASSSLNGPYHSERAARATNGHGIWWRTWRAQESHKKAQMKIRSRQR